MKKIKFLIIIILTIFLMPTVYAGTAYVDSIHIDAKVNTDGSMTVEETITWDITDELNGVYRDILIGNSLNNINSASRIDIEDVIVEGKRFNYSYATLQNGASGLYNVNSINGGKQVKIFTPSEDEYKTTVIKYTLYDVIVKYNDIAELYWNFIGSGWDYGIDDVTINITLPGESETLKVFGHGPLNGYSQIISTRSVRLDVSGLRSGEQVDARVLFDNSLVTPTKVINENKLDSILVQEEKLAEEANARREMAKLAFYGTVIVEIISIIVPIIVYINARRKAKKATFNGKYYRELPEDYGPAVMNKVLYPVSSTTSSNDMLATLLDLVRRKYVEVEPVIKEGKKKPDDYILKLIKTDLTELNDSEKHFIQKLIFVDKNEIALKELSKKNSRSVTAQEKAYRQYTKWVEIVSDIAKEKDLLKKQKVEMGKDVVKCIIGLLLLIIAIFYGVICNYDGIAAIGTIGVLISIFELVFVTIGLQDLKIRTEKGIEHKAMWLAFKKFLQDFSKLDEHDYKSIAIWEHYLVYATALGVSKKVIKELKIIYPTEFNEDSHTFGTYTTIALLSDSSTFNSFGSSFTSAAGTAFSSPSSSGGSGGGFSGGGGGGRRRRWRWRILILSHNKKGKIRKRYVALHIFFFKFVEKITANIYNILE